MKLTKSEESALNGEEGEIMQMAYRILSATGEATDADKLIPIKWAHLSGVNYNTIGDAGEEFLSSITDAKVKVKTTLNPMGFDIDEVDKSGLDENFVSKQISIKSSYETIGVTPSFSCIPYEIFDTPKPGTQVAFAESNAAIYANSYDNLKTNKESAFSALASAITGKSPYTALRKDDAPNITVRMKVKEPDELTYGMLGFFAGRVGDDSVNICDLSNTMDKRQCKAMCGGMGTSGTCAKFVFDQEIEGESVDFDKDQAKNIHDELNTAEKGDIVALGSPQLGFQEIRELAKMVQGRVFKKRCMIFTPRVVKEHSEYSSALKRAGCEILADCCICLSPLIKHDDVDAVTTNSIKGAFYLKNSNKVDVNLKPLAQIIQEETE